MNKIILFLLVCVSTQAVELKVHNVKTLANGIIESVEGLQDAVGYVKQLNYTLDLVDQAIKVQEMKEVERDVLIQRLQGENTFMRLICLILIIIMVALVLNVTYNGKLK